MNNRERMIAALNGDNSAGLPNIEWATWWTETINSWGTNLSNNELFHHFGLDDHYQIWISVKDKNFSKADHKANGAITNRESYLALKHLLYPKSYLLKLKDELLKIKTLHDKGDIIFWFTLEGFFWFPRTLFGIENHLFAFYDEPELMKEINSDLTEYYKKILEVIYSVLTPEYMTFAEDMSYNLGPMLSKEQYLEFLHPYYEIVVPLIKEKGTKVFIDTDGQVEPLIPWFKDSGIEGCLPLERMAGVDVNRLRENHPDWLMIGGFDKTVMKNGESAMRCEFERISPAIKSGKYIPSVDHQTPPDVTMEQYKCYVKLLREYTGRNMEK